MPLMSAADMPPLDASLDEPSLRLDPSAYDTLVDMALEEDHAREDITTAALVPAEAFIVADVIAKQNGVVAGLPVVAAVFHRLDARCQVETEYEDGDQIGVKSHLLTVTGPAHAVLGGERVALNFLGHLSGIASLTAAYVELTMATGVQIHDTRKTTPGWRVLEKYAVRCGGGHNHRLHLEDAAMIKENHLKAAYGQTGPDAIAKAVRACRANLPAGKRLYVEVETQEEVMAAAEAGATVLMLDDFDLGALRRAVKAIRALPEPRPLLEITGGVRLDTVEGLASAGAQRISSGSLTHSARDFDYSMQVRPREEAS
jgi:nicotinate-nucleotide pyrophosphorylase (carboxylating)